MLSHISKLHINGVRSLFFKSILNYSTTTAAAQTQNGFLADYLTNSLGFSKEAAISTLNKVTRSKPKQDPNIVVNFFENLGLNKTHIRDMISIHPRLLFCDVEKNLKPKLQILQDLGLSGSDLVKFIMRYKTLFESGNIRPKIEYVRQLLGSDEKVCVALKRCYCVIGNYKPEMVERNIMLLRNFGISKDNIIKFIVTYPRRIFTTKPEKVQDILYRVENEFGIPRESAMFYYGMHVSYSLSQSKLDTKFRNLRSFGWSEGDICRLVRTQPMILNISEARMRKTLDYLMKELGYSTDYLASRPVFFTLSLERRVKPRNEVLKILNEKKFNKRKVVLYSLLFLSESNFARDYVLPFKDKLPDIYKAYIKNIGRPKIEEVGYV